MEHKNNELMPFTEQEAIAMINDTSKLLAQEKANQLSAAATASHGTTVLANDVEFWQWMGRNYSKGGMFENNTAMQEYIAKGVGKEEWFAKQLQGKGYEWDWMTKERGSLKNIFNQYEAGDIANRVGSDVTKRNLLNGSSSEYQMKAYTSKSNPNLKNTPKDMTVVTNAEKTGVVQQNGYTSVEEFGDANAIKKATNDRLQQVKDGKVHTTYNIRNVGATMAKAGAVGCVVGMGTEAIASYRAWKSGQLSNEAYMKEILKAGGDAGITSGATAGIMVPVSAMIAGAGLSSLISIPIAFVVGGAVNKVVAPCFGRGEYRVQLGQAKYYQNLESGYMDMLQSMEMAADSYYNFVQQMGQQRAVYQELQRANQKLDQDLKALYDSI